MAENLGFLNSPGWFIATCRHISPFPTVRSGNRMTASDLRHLGQFSPHFSLLALRRRPNACASPLPPGPPGSDLGHWVSELGTRNLELGPRDLRLRPRNSRLAP